MRAIKKNTVILLSALMVLCFLTGIVFIKRSGRSPEFVYAEMEETVTFNISPTDGVYSVTGGGFYTTQSALTADRFEFELDADNGTEIGIRATSPEQLPPSLYGNTYSGVYMVSSCELYRSTMVPS